MFHLKVLKCINGRMLPLGDKRAPETHTMRRCCCCCSFCQATTQQRQQQCPTATISNGTQNISPLTKISGAKWSQTLQSYLANDDCNYKAVEVYFIAYLPNSRQAKLQQSSSYFDTLTVGQH